MDIGARLKFIRSRLKLTLDQAAAMFTMTAQTLSRYENGKRTPDNEFLEAFGKKFNLSGDWLLYGEPPIERIRGEEKKCEEIFLNLSRTIIRGNIDKSHLPDVIRVPIDKIIENTTENFLIMLEYMLKDDEVRKNMFQFFYFFQKPLSDKTKGNSPV